MELRKWERDEEKCPCELCHLNFISMREENKLIDLIYHTQFPLLVLDPLSR